MSTTTNDITPIIKKDLRSRRGQQSKIFKADRYNMCERVLENIAFVDAYLYNLLTGESCFTTEQENRANAINQELIHTKIYYNQRANYQKVNYDPQTDPTIETLIRHEFRNILDDERGIWPPKEFYEGVTAGLEAYNKENPDNPLQPFPSYLFRLQKEHLKLLKERNLVAPAVPPQHSPEKVSFDNSRNNTQLEIPVSHTEGKTIFSACAPNISGRNDNWTRYAELPKNLKGLPSYQISKKIIEGKVLDLKEEPYTQACLEVAVLLCLSIKQEKLSGAPVYMPKLGQGDYSNALNVEARKKASEIMFTTISKAAAYFDVPIYMIIDAKKSDKDYTNDSFYGPLMHRNFQFVNGVRITDKQYIINCRGDGGLGGKWPCYNNFLEYGYIPIEEQIVQSCPSLLLAQTNRNPNFRESLTQDPNQPSPFFVSCNVESYIQEVKNIELSGTTPHSDDMEVINESKKTPPGSPSSATKRSLFGDGGNNTIFNVAKKLRSSPLREEEISHSPTSNPSNNG